MRERNHLKTELLLRKEVKLKDLENSSPFFIERNKKACSRENTEGVAKFDKDILDELPQEKLGAIHQYNGEMS